MSLEEAKLHLAGDVEAGTGTDLPLVSSFTAALLVAEHNFNRPQKGRRMVAQWDGQLNSGGPMTALNTTLLGGRGEALPSRPAGGVAELSPHEAVRLYGLRQSANPSAIR